MNNSVQNLSHGKPDTNGYQKHKDSNAGKRRIKQFSKYLQISPSGLDRRGPVACPRLLTIVAVLLILVTLPLSLVFVVKVSPVL